jgi:GH35 family endo-1,4-beta-xylanase
MAGTAAGLAGAGVAAGSDISIRAFLPDGSPAPDYLLKTLLFTASDGRPFALLPRIDGKGTAAIGVPAQKFEIMMVLPVRDFGEVYLYADDAGALYNGGGRELLLNYEFAASRAAFVRRYVQNAGKENIAFSREVTERLERGEAAVRQASAAKETAERVRLANDSLADTMWAGEKAAVERARQRIGRQGPRPGFLFGCNAFKFARSPEYARLFAGLLNYATVPFYRASTERTEGQPNYSQVDGILSKLPGTNILPKGHPLVWFHSAGIPDFLRDRPWPAVRESARQYAFRSVLAYRDRIHAWDIINEAHDWANELGFNHEQLLDLTRMASETVRAADPTAFRVVNSCCTWGEYAATGENYKGKMPQPVRTPLEYLHVLEDARVDYEAIGLQLYDPVRDMLEIERQLQRYFVFGKPVHITELGVPSSDQPDKAPQTNDPAATDPAKKRHVWHAPGWNETTQADWAEQFYTLCYSMPQVQAITWWDFSDPAFIPWGGFVDKDNRPKESYNRLSKLLTSWRSA